MPQSPPETVVEALGAWKDHRLHKERNIEIIIFGKEGRRIVSDNPSNTSMLKESVTKNRFKIKWRFLWGILNQRCLNNRHQFIRSLNTC